MKKSKVKNCKTCHGTGIVQVITGSINDSGDNIELSGTGFALCDRCRGAGITGIKELEALSPKQLAAFVKDKTTENIFSLLNKKTSEEIRVILEPYI